MLKPILFTTQMVRAILDGRKTQTRRAVHYNDLAMLKCPVRKSHNELSDRDFLQQYGSPIYREGDVMYVRETWNVIRLGNEKFGFETIYWYRADDKEENPDDKWRPSIHMPKEAARIFLRVTDVHIERLHEITGHGILLEGIDNGKSNPSMGARWENMQRDAFSELWDRTIGHSSLFSWQNCRWRENPWVWVYTFERIPREEALQ